MPYYGQKLSTKKCIQCRTSKVKCIPWERNWPSEKCNHCVNRGHPCSANLTAKEARLDTDQSSFVSRLDDKRPDDEGHSNVRTMWVEDLSPLMSAVIHGHARVVEILLRAGADLNESSRDQGTCLEIASRKGFHSIVESLLLFGVDANAVGIHYRNALHAASAWNQAEIVEVLLRHGASVNGVQVNLDDFSHATAAQESFQLDKQTRTADIPQDALTSYLLPPQQQEQHENFAASAFPQPMSHSRNQSALPTMGVDPFPAPYAGPSDSALMKPLQHNQNGQKDQHETPDGQQYEDYRTVSIQEK